MTPKRFATSLARQAGEITKKYFFAGVEKQFKEHQSIVTIADKEINALVADSIKKEFPGHGFMGEEGGHFKEKTEYIWLCDPIDGTLLFANGLTDVSFSLALVRDGEPILGAVYHPFADRLYLGEKDKGTTLNGKIVRVNSARDSNRGLIGFFAWDKARYDLADTITALIRLGFDFQTGSTAYIGALVGSGDAMANIFPHSTPWDVAAVKVIVEEAGGRVTDLFGNTQRYDRETKGQIASNGLIHDELVEIIRKTMKE